MTRLDVLLAQSCQKFSDRIAIETQSEFLTYSRLLDRALHIERELRSVGIGCGDTVAVLGHRSAAVISAVFATWAAGATVMLIDDALPEARKESMLAIGSPAAHVICTDTFTRVTRNETSGARNGLSKVDSSPDLAYLAFTSGSTGEPKAIAGSNAGLSHFLRWQTAEFDISPGDRFAHLTNLSFDVWFRDALTPLVGGSTLCIPPELHMDSHTFVDFVRRERITGLHLVPSLGRAWTLGRDIEREEGLRIAFFAGEPLDAAIVAQWRSVFPASEVVNLYGPTETTLAQLFHRVPTSVQAGTALIGTNIPGSTTLIMAGDLACADGEVGEICIAAQYPSHGYLVDGVIESPFVTIEINGKRSTVYRTGDLGRRNVDGTFAILGRADDQIKIAGVRIELNEIRATIASHSSVRDVLVSAHDDGISKTIVAVVEGDAAREQELRIFLSERLLNVMLPSAYVYTTRLPSLPNGKLDRRAASDMARNAIAERRESRASKRRSGSVAERLGVVWDSVLPQRVESQSAHDISFFDAGGSSFTIVNLHLEIQDEFDLRFPLVRLFEHASFDSQRRFLEDCIEPRSVLRPRLGSTVRSVGRSSALSARKARRTS